MSDRASIETRIVSLHDDQLLGWTAIADLLNGEGVLPFGSGKQWYAATIRNAYLKAKPEAPAPVDAAEPEPEVATPRKRNGKRRNGESKTDTVLVTGPDDEQSVPTVATGVSLALTWACRRDTPAGTTYYVRENGKVKRHVIAGVEGAVAVVKLVKEEA